ncbi:MAG: hypothetical protein GTN78_10390, partial [Gemmatimonadales bacterium]|nr:hypothetical protein [Gemmatimonadales bacterium]
TMLGAGATLLIAIMRLRYIGWCLHPVPFVVTAGAGTFVGFFWMPFLIAWILKLVIVRYWGRKGFCTALPFFLGLILGEMIGGMVWPLYGVITQSRCYSFFGA